VATDEELLGDSAPERWATPEASLSAVRISAEEAKGVPSKLEPKGDLPCRHNTIKVSIRW